MKFTPFQPNRIIYNKGEKLPDDFYPKENWLLRALLYRQRLNKNSFVLVTGEQRVGKSAFCIKECERINELNGREFDVDHQLTLDDIKKFFIWSRTAFNSEFIIDEIGTQLSTNQYWSIISSILRVFSQTQGFRCNIVFFVLPFAKILQSYFKYNAVYGIKVIDTGKAKVYKRVIDTLNDKKPYFKSKFITINFDLPKEPIWNRYLEIKKEWNDRRIDTDIDVIDKMNETNEQKAKNFVLRQKSLELGVALKEERMKQIDIKNKLMMQKEDAFFDNMYV
jgi:hypothetical protein